MAQVSLPSAMSRSSVAAAVLIAAFTTHADEAAVRRMVQDKLRASGSIESIQKAPWGALYEVVVRSPDGLHEGLPRLLIDDFEFGHLVGFRLALGMQHLHGCCT